MYLAMSFLGMVCLLALATALAGVWQLYQFVARRTWRKRVKLPPLTGYVAKSSYVTGETIPVFIHSTEPAEAVLWRLDVGQGERQRTYSVPTCVQSNAYNLWRGLAWRESLSLDTSGLASGLYVLELRHTGPSSAQYRVPIVLKPDSAVDVAVIASTNTWQAYNAFGGLSNYQDAATPFPLNLLTLACRVFNIEFTLGDCRRIPCVPLPFRRPVEVVNEDLADWNHCPVQQPSHLARAERPLLQLLSEHSIPYGVFSDWDVAFDAHLAKAKVWIFHAHSEYWSEEMIGRLREFLDRGGKAMFLSGNNLYRKVQFLEHGLMVYGFKVPKREVSTLLGAAYDASGYLSYAGYQVADADHWVFEGTGLKDGDIFGAETNPATPGAAPVGASGYETDKITADSGNIRVLAIGQNAEGPAYMVFKETGKGGWVFNCGSVAFAPWINRDPVLAGIVRNLVAKALQDQSAASTPVAGPARRVA